MKKRNKSRILSVVILLSMLFGMSVETWAWYAYDEVESISSETTSSGITFTITRKDASKSTIFNYRTLDGSAVGGIHFTHQSGQLYFAEKETKKQVKVPILDASGIDAYVDRKMGFVAWHDYGWTKYAEASLGGMKACPYSDSERKLEVEMKDAKSGTVNEERKVGAIDVSGFSDEEIDYFNATKQDWDYYYRLLYTCRCSQSPVTIFVSDNTMSEGDYLFSQFTKDLDKTGDRLLIDVEMPHHNPFSQGKTLDDSVEYDVGCYSKDMTDRVQMYEDSWYMTSKVSKATKLYFLCHYISVQ